MGSKVEYIVALFIVFIGLIAYFLQMPTPKEQKKSQVSNKKETELNNFIEYEINATALSHILRAKNAYKVNTTWYLKEPNITSESIKKLHSKRAIYTKDTITFLEDVYALREDNTTYNSQKAIYLKGKEELLTPKKFLLQRPKSKVVGTHLLYKANSKETFAKDVQGKFKLKEANE